MNRLIYQVYVGKRSKLYDFCTESVKQYCDRFAIDHYVLKQPKLRIKPDVFTTNRSVDSYQKHGGFLPIYEKENAFDLIDQYDQIAIVDADIWVRPSTDQNIFDHFGTDHPFGAVCEREMLCKPWYVDKLKNYSAMQYGQLHGKDGLDFKPTERGFEFFNMGMIMINSQLFAPYLKNQTAKQFLDRTEFKRFIDGQGHWKWSTDQTLLNYFLKKYSIPVKHLDDVWNGLYTARHDIDQCNFVHFFLKDKLPNRGEDVEGLMKDVQ